LSNKDTLIEGINQILYAIRATEVRGTYSPCNDKFITVSSTSTKSAGSHSWCCKTR